MKYLIFIYAMFIFGLSTFPCSDMQGCNDAPKEEHSESQNHDHSHDHQENDNCTPFCSCACCGTSISTPESQINIVRIDEFDKELRSPILMKYNSGNFKRLWRPPSLLSTNS